MDRNVNEGEATRLTLVERELSREALGALREDLVRRLSALAALNPVQVKTVGSFAAESGQPRDIDVIITVGARLREEAVNEAVVREVVDAVSERLISGDELSVCCKRMVLAGRQMRTWQLHLELTVMGLDGKLTLNTLKPHQEGDRFVISRGEVVTFFSSFDQPAER
jgi:hypothetical protein